MVQDTNPHDELFKVFMTDLAVAQDFLKAHLSAEVLEYCDLTTLCLEDETFVTPSMHQHFSGVLYSVKAKGATKGTIYILVERLDKPDKWLVSRMNVIQRDVMQRHLDLKRGEKLPVVIPIVFYHGAEPYAIAANKAKSEC